MEDLDELREEEENPLKDMYMTFKSGNEHFGISVSNPGCGRLYQRFD